MAAMERSRIRRVALKREGFEIELERESSERGEHYVPQSPPPQHIPQTAPRGVPEAPMEEPTTDGYFVTSPMVGTFYSSPSPDDPPFIKIGDVVDEESVVCIIEAMKVMNEVKAGVKGTVTAVLVKNGDPVEFGTNIIRIKPA